MSRIMGNLMISNPMTTALLALLVGAGWKALRSWMDDSNGVRPSEREGQYPALRTPQIVLPYTDDYGHHYTWNSSYMIPYWDIAGLTEMSWRGVRRLGRAAVPMALQGPFTFVTQESKEGKQLVNDYIKNPDKASNQTKQVIIESLMAEAPGLLGQYWRSLYMDAAKQPSQQQGKAVVGGLSPMFGIRKEIAYQPPSHAHRHKGQTTRAHQHKARN
jgi:hypothetical protein